MNKQELTQAIEKAKRQLSLAKEQDEKDFAQKKIARLEKELSEIEKPKEEPKKKEEAKPKAEPKTESKPEAKTESKGASKPKRDDDDLADCDELEEREVKAKKYGYDLDELLNKAKEGKAKAKKRAQERANEPKKTPATRNKEAVAKTTERVTTNVEGRAKKGNVDAREIEKLIAEYEEAISKLKKILAGLKGGKKMARGGGVEARKNPKIVRSYFEEEEFEYRRGGSTTNSLMQTFENLHNKYRKDNNWDNSEPMDGDDTEKMANEIAENENWSMKNKKAFLKYADEREGNMAYGGGVGEEYRRGGYTTPRTTGSDPKRDKMYHALPSGKRQSNRISEIEKRDGTSFMRRNANQYVDAKHSGNREYYESANNRSDKGKWY